MRRPSEPPHPPTLAPDASVPSPGTTLPPETTEALSIDCPRKPDSESWWSESALSETQPFGITAEPETREDRAAQTNPEVSREAEPEEEQKEDKKIHSDTPTGRGVWDAITTRAKKELAKLTESAHEDEGTDEERAEQLSDEGFALLRKGDLDGAKSVWTEACRLAPRNRIYRANLNRLLRRLG